jgi:hypothetical protein
MKRPVCIPYALQRFFVERDKGTCAYCHEKIESSLQCWRLFVVCSAKGYEAGPNANVQHVAHSSLQNYHAQCAVVLKELCETDRIFKVAFFMPENTDPLTFRVQDTVLNSINCTGLTCGYCGAAERMNTSFPRCRRCKAQCYCSRECHEADWPRHKAECKRRICSTDTCLMAMSIGDQVKGDARLSLGSKCMLLGCSYRASLILSVRDNYECNQRGCRAQKIPGTNQHEVLIGCCSIKCLHALQRKSKVDPTGFVPEPIFECTL